MFLLCDFHGRFIRGRDIKSGGLVSGCVGGGAVAGWDGVQGRMRWGEFLCKMLCGRSGAGHRM